MIPAFDLGIQYRQLKNEIARALDTVLEGGEFILGPAVKEFEQRMSTYCGCTHAVGVASGTDALRLGMAALGLGPKDEVITTPFTFIATANTISHAGGVPVFVDVEPATFNLDPALIEKAVTPRTKGIVVVHLFGQPASMDEILAIAKRRGLWLIEDCAQALGAEYRGRRVGSLGDLGALSFYPTKNLGAYGDAGMVITNRPDIAKELDILRRQGSLERYQADRLGFNSRLDSLQAAVLSVKMKYLEAWNARRRAIAQQYTRLLGGLPLQTPPEVPGMVHAYHQYTIKTAQRDALAGHLRNLKIGTMVYYPMALHRQPIYRSLGYQAGSLPVAEQLARQVLSLPMYPELTDADIGAVSGAIRRFFG